MRITKKFAGSSCIGKQVFTPADMTILQERENFLVMQVRRRLHYMNVFII